MSWDAFSPFTGRSSTYLRRLVATRLQQVPSLREQIERFVGRRSEAVVLEYDRLDIALRRRIGELLEDRFTGLVREHRVLFELLTLLEYKALPARVVASAGNYKARVRGGRPSATSDHDRHGWTGPALP
ncbi:hypothetical protein [Micromonospora sp. NBC_01638]|uniref:hypothetical protein n=1 Tax=Micromonospora sp. NBC_01638 TaxID=2975982 RepID=UPI00386D8750|nr:hypothetical protein OG811_21795 [Micromonospora sp. NBC_01638]